MLDDADIAGAVDRLSPVLTDVITKAQGAGGWYFVLLCDPPAAGGWLTANWKQQPAAEFDFCFQAANPTDTDGDPPRWTADRVDQLIALGWSPSLEQPAAATKSSDGWSEDDLSRLAALGWSPSTEIAELRVRNIGGAAAVSRDITDSLVRTLVMVYDVVDLDGLRFQVE